jgi:hypothetical protein
MLTQCPSCQVRARLPDEHEGTRVRCSECGALFVARRSGAPDEERRSRRRRLAVLVGGLALTALAGLVCAPARLEVASAARARPRSWWERADGTGLDLAATHEELPRRAER